MTTTEKPEGSFGVRELLCILIVVAVTQIYTGVKRTGTPPPKSILLYSNLKKQKGKKSPTGQREEIIY